MIQQKTHLCDSIVWLWEKPFCSFYAKLLRRLNQKLPEAIQKASYVTNILSTLTSKTRAVWLKNCVYIPVTDELSLSEVTKTQLFNKAMLFIRRMFSGVMYKSMTIKSVASVIISTKYLEKRNRRNISSWFKELCLRETGCVIL